MRIQLRKLVPLIAFAACSCGSKDGEAVDPSLPEEVAPAIVSRDQPENSSATAAAATPVVTVLPDATPAARAPSAPTSYLLSLELGGVPNAYSTAAALHATVSGDGIESFVFALLDGAVSCDGAAYGEALAFGSTIDRDVGADGVKTLCLLASGVDATGTPHVAQTSRSWTQDTTAPQVAAEFPSSFGPYESAATSVSFGISATDAGAGIAQIEASVIDVTSAACYDPVAMAFSAACPRPLSIVGTASVMVAKAALTAGHQYAVTVSALDRAGNAVSDTLGPLAWDTVAPVAGPVTLTAIASPRLINLSWSPVSDAASYLVVRREGLPVSYVPPAALPPVPGTQLVGDQVVLAATSSLALSDQPLTEFRTYYYKVFAVDAAGNVSPSGASASAQVLPFDAFQGLTYGYVWGPGARFGLEWQPYAAPGATAATTTYRFFKASTPSGQDFAASPAASATGTASLFTVAAEANVYGVVRNGVDDGNTRELRIRLGSGVHHKIASNGRVLGADPVAQYYLRQAYVAKFDPWGNIIFSGAPGTLNAYCLESTHAYYCLGRTIGRIYTIVGRDGVDDGADGELASANSIGDVNGVAFDSRGNLFLADATFARIRGVCYDPLAEGFCKGRTRGFIYHIAGTGTIGDGVDDAVAKTTAIGAPSGLDVDSAGNIVVADATYYRLRLVCARVSGLCTNRVAGNSYFLAGTGALGDGADAAGPLLAAIGSPRGVAVSSGNNVYFADWDYRRVRAVCADVAPTAGFCASKIAGKAYRIMGTGVAADGNDNVNAATSGLGQAYGIALSAAGNIYVADATYFRVRAICFSAAASGACSGATVGRAYRVAGIGTNADGATNALGVVVAIGDPRMLTVDADENIVTTDQQNRRLRLICKTTSGRLCADRYAEYHYQLIGSGTNSQGWQANAMTTPIGTPQALATDSRGNVYYGDSTYFLVRVTCYDVSPGAGFCDGKATGRSYFLAGNGISADGLDGSLAVASSIGTPVGLDVDANGNVFIADQTFRRVRVVCVNIAAPGPCSGKVSGNIYRYIGTGGAAADAANNVVAATAIGTPGDVSLDQNGNVWLADNQYFRLRLICRVASGICAGRTIGNMYNYAGTGATGDAAGGTAAATTAMGAPLALARDAAGNVVISDGTYFRLRVVCISASGLCAGRTVGNAYRLAGTGVTGDGVSDAAASTTAMGAGNGLAIDSSGNVWIADSGYRRIRVLCRDVTAAGYCYGRTVDNIYRGYGNGLAAGDPSSGVAGSLVRLDTPSRDALALAPSGDLLYVGSSGAVRLFRP